MWILRGCPRCGGDINRDDELGGPVEVCLQCGYRREMEPITAPIRLTKYQRRTGVKAIN